MRSDERLSSKIRTITNLPEDREKLTRAINALLVNSIPDEPKKHVAWIDDLPEFEGDEGLRSSSVEKFGGWSEEHLQEFARRERTRRRSLRNGFAGFIAKQFAAEFVKEMKQS